MNAINSSFIVLCTLLVLLMTPALAMFYSGMVRSKNTLNTIMNCFIVFGVITLQWVVFGFSFSFGKDEGLGLVGNFENFLLEGISGYNASGVPNILFVIFQMMFALIASAIITGSLVGRIKLGVLVIFLLFWSTLVYDVLAHMIWSSEGFLLKRGSLDFAGGGVVHISSGVAGLVGALIVGARKSDDEDKNAHSIPYAFLGAILLFIGWLGFNAGSAGEMNDIAINAFIVSIISAACGYVDIYASLVIGTLSSVFCYFGLSFIKYKLKWDDSLDAFSLHGIGGIWGGIATGLFASAKVNPNVIAQNTLGEGFFISGSLELLKEQIFAIVICVVLSALISFVIFKIISCFTDLRVKEEVEQKGLDVSLHGEKAYTLA
ncbi:TPA: ammonium transporter [Campylobacter jejuni]|nr:ammonium transporter [Campylobacter jejuni]HED0811045.1 ammonium transporter [Campylobacter jejuni]HED1057853.1 ammonium transporter [Campylobacter jejuni]